MVKFAGIGFKSENIVVEEQTRKLLFEFFVVSMSFFDKISRELFIIKIASSRCGMEIRLGL